MCERRALRELGLGVNSRLIAAPVGLLAAAAMMTSAMAQSADPSHVAACTNVHLGFVGPLSGPAAYLGNEQLSWLRFAVDKYNRAYKMRFKVARGDTQLKAPVARTVARRMVANGNVRAIIGPSEGQAVRAGGNTYERAGLVAISGSATAIDLTKGRPYATFFRVVPHEGVQGPTIVSHVARTLNAAHVVVIDSQDEDYSMPIAATVTRGLRKAGVTVSRESVSEDHTDFSSIVAYLDDDVDVVVFATQVAAAADALANELREQGKEAIVVGTDGAYSPSQFRPRSGYVSVFAPDLHFSAQARSIVREYNRYAKHREFGVLGPATYMAGWVAMDRIRNACSDGRATRSEVTAAVRRTNVPSIIGDNIRFDKKGDVRGVPYAIYKVTNGKYSLVGP